MSALLKELTYATVFYWPSFARGGVGVGHISVLFKNGLYISHVPDLHRGTPVGTRATIPGSSRTDWIIVRHASLRNRSLAADEKKFGLSWQSLTLPEKFLTLPMEETGKSFLLANAPHELPLHGPLPYYQIADSKEGAGDRQQCATTTAMVLGSGLTLDMQEHYKKIMSEYKPDSLWDTVNALASRFRTLEE